ncbi:MAG: hypothetical protein RL238_1018 [Actinomycetota bacterium]
MLNGIQQMGPCPGKGGSNVERWPDRFRLIAEHAADVVVQFDEHGVIEWVSPSITKVASVRPDFVIGHPMAYFVTDEYDDVVDDLIQKVLTGGEASFEGKVHHVDGSTFWVSVNAAPVRGADGVVIGGVAMLRDVDELVKMRDDLAAANRRLRATLDTLFDPHVLLQAMRDEHGKVYDFLHLESNEAACHYNGATREQLIGSTLMKWSPQDHDYNRMLVDMFAQVIETGIPLVLDDWEFPERVRDGSKRRFDIRVTKVDDCVSNSWRDVTDRHRWEERLSHLATHDPLTGLANRAALVDELTRALHAGRRAGSLVAVVMLDLDHFKNVNDSLGHPVGDQLLKAAARRLEDVVRSGDLVARIGGDEFVIVMRDLVESSEALRVALRIVEGFRLPITAAGHELHATASVGVAIAGDDADTESLLGEADTALYRAKDGGRDRASLFNDDLRTAAHARVTLEAQLRPALDLGELAVYYQPEVDLRTGRVCAVEALLRWHHPSGELYAADRFIDVAEEIGMIVDSGNWVVREACAQAAAWCRGDEPLRVGLRLNLSKPQLAEAGLIAAFDAAIAESGVDPTLLCVEISEASLIRPSVTMANNLAELRARGVRLAIDNFGTGYAALGYLRERPVDLVKIDRSFVRDIGVSDYSRRLVAGIAALAQQMGLDVSAEGVETPEQAQYLASLGCTSAQGFLYSPAVPGTEMGVLLRRVFPTH